MDDLVRWLTEVWDEEEAAALDAAGWDQSGRVRADGQWVRVGISSIEDSERRSIIYSDSGQVTGLVADHIAAHDPASVLARIAADRKILGRYRNACKHADDLTEDESIRQEWGVIASTYEEALHEIGTAYRDRPGYQESWAVQ